VDTGWGKKKIRGGALITKPLPFNGPFNGKNDGEVLSFEPAGLEGLQLTKAPGMKGKNHGVRSFFGHRCATAPPPSPLGPVPQSTTAPGRGSEGRLPPDDHRKHRCEAIGA